MIEGWLRVRLRKAKEERNNRLRKKGIRF